MSNRSQCPACSAEIIVGAQSESIVICPECGSDVPLGPKPVPAVAGARPRKAEGEVGPRRAGVELGRQSPSHASPPKRARPLPREVEPAHRPMTWPLAAGGALGVGVLVIGLVLAFRGSDGQSRLADDLEARKQAAPINEFPPVAWDLQPRPAPKLDFPDELAVQFADRYAWEIALPGSGPEYLSVEPVPEGRAVHFGRFDLKTGRPIAPSKRLQGSLSSFGPNAVAPDGTLVLGTAPDGNFQIYDSGQASPRTIPGLSPVDSRGTAKEYWFDFAADGRLWVLKESALEAWDLSAGKPAFTAAGRFTLPLVMSPDRNWLVAQVDEKYLEVLDASTGACRGRFGGEGRWQGLAVSLDAKRLAGVRFPGAGFAPGPNAYDFPFEVHVWDLTTGKPQGIIGMVRKQREVKSIHWLTSERLLVEEALLDVNQKLHIGKVTVKSAPGSEAPGLLKTAGWTSDGRWWADVGMGQLVPVTIPQEILTGEPAFRPGDAVAVVAECGDLALDARAQAIMSDALQTIGYRIEPGGWSLRVAATASDGSKKIGEVAVPEVKGTIELVAPDGSVTANSTHRGGFPMGPGSKYYIKSEQSNLHIAGQGTTDLYDFGSQWPADAMREEAWNHFLRTLPDSPWPRTAWKSGGKYVQLPITIEVNPISKANR